MSLDTSAGIILFFFPRSVKCQRTEIHWVQYLDYSYLLSPEVSDFFRTLTLGYNPFCCNIGWNPDPVLKVIMITKVGEAGKGGQDGENKEHGSRKIGGRKVEMSGELNRSGTGKIIRIKRALKNIWRLILLMRQKMRLPSSKHINIHKLLITGNLWSVY